MVRAAERTVSRHRHAGVHGTLNAEALSTQLITLRLRHLPPVLSGYDVMTMTWSLAVLAELHQRSVGLSVLTFDDRPQFLDQIGYLLRLPSDLSLEDSVCRLAAVVRPADMARINIGTQSRLQLVTKKPVHTATVVLLFVKYRSFKLV